MFNCKIYFLKIKLNGHLRHCYLPLFFDLFEFVNIENIISGVLGSYPKLLVRFRTQIAGIACIIGFISGLIYITQVRLMYLILKLIR